MVRGLASAICSSRSLQRSPWPSCNDFEASVACLSACQRRSDLIPRGVRYSLPLFPCSPLLFSRQRVPYFVILLTVIALPISPANIVVPKSSAPAVTIGPGRATMACCSWAGCGAFIEFAWPYHSPRSQAALRIAIPSLLHFQSSRGNFPGPSQNWAQSVIQSRSSHPFLRKRAAGRGKTSPSFSSHFRLCDFPSPVQFRRDLSLRYTTITDPLAHVLTFVSVPALNRLPEFNSKDPEDMALVKPIDLQHP